MKKILLLTIFLSGTLFGQSQSFKDFKWLKGTWERQGTKPGSTAFESWGEMTHTGFKGLGTTLAGVDTVWVEKLSIVKKEKALYYVAEVDHNAAPTYFKITSYSKNGFVCENPSHDFPKKIDYTLEGNLLTVVISGDGKEVPFVFSKRN